MVAAMLFSFTRSFTIAWRNRASRCTFARSALQCSGASHPALRVPACGELRCFRYQLLRIPNGFRFLRIHACSDLSSFSCVWHIFMVLLSAIQDVQFCTDPPPSPVHVLLCRRTLATQDGMENQRSPGIRGYSHCSKISICFLMDATLSSISSASASRLGEIVLSFRAWCSS